MSSRTAIASGEAGILSRVLGNGSGKMTLALARHILTLGFDDDDQQRMADLAERNQLGRLSEREHAELMEYVRAGHVLALLNARARKAFKSRT